MFSVNTAAGGGKITQTLGLIGWSSCNLTIIPASLGSPNLTVIKTPVEARRDTATPPVPTGHAHINIIVFALL